MDLRDDYRPTALDLIGAGFYLILVGQEQINQRLDHLQHQLNRLQRMEQSEMATIDELSASLDAQKASLDNLTTLEAAEAAGGLQPGQVAVDQATLDAAAQKVADNQAEIDALIAADQTPQP